MAPAEKTRSSRRYEPYSDPHKGKETRDAERAAEAKPEEEADAAEDVSAVSLYSAFCIDSY